MKGTLSRVYSAELEGIHARRIEVETDVHVGLHAFTIVGLADKALNEAKERVNSALKNSGVKPPTRENRKITVNLAPADIKKTGSHYDFAIAIGYLLATEQIAEFETGDKLFVGELALDGTLRGVRGALNIAHMAQELGFRTLYLPQENANEAAAIPELTVIPVGTLLEAIAILEGKDAVAPATYAPRAHAESSAPDFSEIKAQEFAKRALTIAAAGGHNLLMIGPPGVGKSLLAQALVGILPDLHHEEAIEITKIYSAAGKSPNGLIAERPFRSPHQTASLISIVGGGGNPRPGEISLAHRGILFLDELPEFPKNILEGLRGPLESGIVHVARAKDTLSFPSKFSLIAAMNPCPCGFYGDEEKECKCAAYEVIRYQKKISGPLLDRIDLQIRVPRVALAALREKQDVTLESPAIKKRIEAVRETQAARFTKLPIRTNAEMSAKQAETFARLEHDAEKFLKTLDSAKLSPRGYYRLLKTARTIADLESSNAVTAGHLAEAYGYRLKEQV
jgi:magnesium chelatase family protein